MRMGVAVLVPVPMRVRVRVLGTVTVAMAAAGVVVTVLSTGFGAATVATGEDPEDFAAAAAPTEAEVLGVLLLVPADGAGLFHLTHACATGPLATKEGATHLDDPAVDRGHLLVPLPGTFLWLRVQI